MRIPYLKLLVLFLAGQTIVNANEEEFESRDLATNTKKPSSRTTSKPSASPSIRPTRFPERPNILLVISDDLRAAELEQLEYDASPVRFPNIKKLIKKSRTISAWPIDPVCGPSRNALLTSVEFPQVVDFNRDYRSLGYNSIFEILRDEDDYITQDFGKVMHFSADRLSKHTLFTRNETSAPNPCITNGNNDCKKQRIGCKLPIKETTDYKVANYAIKALREFASRTKTNPNLRFFYAVGFHNTHIQMSSSVSYSHNLPPVNTVAVNANLDGYKYSLNHLQCDDMVASKVGAVKIVPSGKIADVDNITKNRKVTDLIRDLYLNSQDGVDIKIGMLLDTLAQLGLDDDTIVIITSDHGFNVGEKNQYCKRVITDEMKIPLVVYWPKVTDKKPGRSKAIASLSDVSVTILDIVRGIKSYTHPSGITTTGISFKEALDDPNIAIRERVTSTIYRCQDPSKTAMSNPCTSDKVTGACDRPEIKWVGYSVTTNYLGKLCRWLGFFPYNEVSNCEVERYYGQPNSLKTDIKSKGVNVFQSGPILKRGGVFVEPIQQELICQNASALYGQDDNPNVRNLIDMPAYKTVVSNSIRFIRENRQIVGGEFPYQGPKPRF